MKKSPYGSWKSPITTELIVSKSKGLFDIKIYGKEIYWTESRPNEGGRSTIVKKGIDGIINTLVPMPFNTRSRVHEYGGLAYEVDEDYLYFCNFSDQRIYRVKSNQAPQAITPEGNYRYADLTKDVLRNRLICIREEHSKDFYEPINTIVSINLSDKNDVKVIAEGCDFYAYPKISPDGKYLAYICWKHPNMPWDGTELWIGELSENSETLKNTKKIAGSDSEAIFQPEWSPDGVLYFVSDKSGWWNIYKYQYNKITPVLEMEADFGYPLWNFHLWISIKRKNNLHILRKGHLETGKN